MIITHKKVKELEEIKEALMIRIEDLHQQIKQLESDLKLVEENRDVILEENQRLKSIVTKELDQQFAYAIFICKKDNRIHFWNNNRFEHRITGITLNASLDSVATINVTYQ